jgi:6-pyruvoyltetrahydropterin/6-carboxytetrahydropterin synthase
MYDVTVEAWFSGSHQLRLPGGNLEPLHGHNWKVEARFEGPDLNACGVLVDFVEVEAALRTIIGRYHHQHLNDLEEFRERNPSAENVARIIFDCLAAAGPFGESLVSTKVWEAPGCAGGYSRPLSA